MIPIRTSFTKYELILLSTNNASHSEMKKIFKKINEIIRNITNVMRQRCSHLQKLYGECKFDQTKYKDNLDCYMNQIKEEYELYYKDGIF